MSAGADIEALASALVAKHRSDKTAAVSASTSAPVASTAAENNTELVTAIRKCAEALRTLPEPQAVTLDAVRKHASLAQPSTGAQAPSTGASLGGSLPGPSLPSLKTTNLGVTAGSGGAAPAAKIASVLREYAAALRAYEPTSNETKTAHVLNAAVGLQLLQEVF